MQNNVALTQSKTNRLGASNFICPSLSMACKGRIQVLKSELGISFSSLVRQLFQIELIEVGKILICVSEEKFAFSHYTVIKHCTTELTGYTDYFIIRSLFYLFLLTLI